MDELPKRRGISDPGPHHLHDQQFNGRYAAWVYESLRSYADSWGERGVRAWEEGWWEMAVGEPSAIYEMRPTRNTVSRFMSY
jgi:hypothetical protein